MTLKHAPCPDRSAEARLLAPASPAPAPAAPFSPRLHYTSSPLQRRADRNGISARENAAIHHLSGGQVNLHAMGASIQRVSGDDPRLAAVGARSYAQGSHALISSDRDRGHELWHMAQQAMGQVTANASVGGQPLNTQDHLERDADRMSARIAAFSGAE